MRRVARNPQRLMAMPFLPSSRPWNSVRPRNKWHAMRKWQKAAQLKALTMRFTNRLVQLRRARQIDAQQDQQPGFEDFSLIAARG